MSKIFINPEVKRISLKFIVFQIIFIITVCTYFNIKMEKLKVDAINQNTSIIGSILYKNPQLEDDVVRFFTKEISKEEIKLGESIASKYQYTSSLPIKVTPYINTFHKNTYRSIFIFFLVSSTLILLIILSEYRNIFTKVNKISIMAERAVEGDIENLEYNQDGEFAVLAHNFNNMTNRLKLTIEALDREKVYLKDIISDISHQLKTPLSSLMILNDIMLKRNITKEKHMEFLDKSREQLERMEWLIINLLKMAKMEVGNVKFNFSNDFVINTINKSVSLLKPSIEEKGHSILVKENNQNIKLYHDEEWLAESFTNIIKNCVEHTEHNGIINIEVDETPLFVRISISDDGEGIEPKDLPHIFERFYKASTSKSNSIGIGLSLAKTIIEKHGGDIKVRSILGNGTEFTITFLKNMMIVK